MAEKQLFSFLCKYLYYILLSVTW